MVFRSVLLCVKQYFLSLARPISPHRHSEKQQFPLALSKLHRVSRYFFSTQSFSVPLCLPPSHTHTFMKAKLLLQVLKRCTLISHSRTFSLRIVSPQRPCRIAPGSSGSARTIFLLVYLVRKALAKTIPFHKRALGRSARKKPTSLKTCARSHSQA